MYTWDEFMEVVKGDPIVYAVVMDCQMRGIGREEMLIACVVLLHKKARGLEEMVRVALANGVYPMWAWRDGKLELEGYKSDEKGG